ncbi:MAG: hypothetical protein AVO39_03495 [delta proteobacterium MLS_D]|nr:MAG: hypothetical protein AVO39_03495 [delta proteobacterium MLS_D]
MDGENLLSRTYFPLDKNALFSILINLFEHLLPFRQLRVFSDSTTDIVSAFSETVTCRRDETRKRVPCSRCRHDDRRGNTKKVGSIEEGGDL